MIDPLFSAQLDAKFPDVKTIGVAVSGGGDSMALLESARRHSATTKQKLCVATVDHGLRDTAQAEIDLVADFCKSHKLSWTCLQWTGWDGTGNLQSKARDARRDLLARWASDNDVDVILMGHTKDDVAETFLMRLARGSGVDGLSAMSAVFEHEGIPFFRPLLESTRAELRAYLVDAKVNWSEDPSNEDERFDRVKIRNAWETLEGLGLTRARLATTAGAMISARKALQTQTRLAAEHSIKPQQLGFVEISLSDFIEQPEEIQQRLMCHAMSWITGQPYRPRKTALDGFIESAISGKTASLQGCLLLPSKGTLILCREPNAVSKGETPKLFDNRWACATDAKQITADQISSFRNWKDICAKREILASLPSMIDDDGNPLLPDPTSNWGKHFVLKRSIHEFFTTIESH